MMKKYILTLFMCIITQFLWAQFRISTGNPINVACNPNEKNVVWQALELFKRDYRNVFSDSVRISESQGNIIVSTMGKNNPLMTSLQVDLSSLEGKKQGFMYNPQIQISAESGTKRSNFRQKDKTKRSKKGCTQHL